MAIDATLLVKLSTYGTTNTTASVDTSGVTKIVAYLTFDTGAFSSFTDSKGNTWTQRGSEATAANGQILRRYDCEGATVGSGHTFTLTLSASGSVAMFILSVTGAAASFFDQTATPVDDTSSPYASNSLTPNQAGSLLLSFISTSGGLAGTTHDPSANGFTLIDQYANGTAELTSAVAKKVLSAASATTASWTTGAAVSGGLVTLEVYKELVASGQGRLVGGILAGGNLIGGNLA